MKTEYINGFHHPNGGSQTYGPPIYITNSEPVEYRGLLIYKRFDACFDVVKDNICIGNYAGLRGAKGLIDKIIDTPDDFWSVRAMEFYTKARAL